MINCQADTWTIRFKPLPVQQIPTVTMHFRYTRRHNVSVRLADLTQVGETVCVHAGEYQFPERITLKRGITLRPSGDVHSVTFEGTLSFMLQSSSTMAGYGQRQLFSTSRNNVTFYGLIFSGGHGSTGGGVRTLIYLSDPICDHQAFTQRGKHMLTFASSLITSAPSMLQVGLH